MRLKPGFLLRSLLVLATFLLLLIFWSSLSDHSDPHSHLPQVSATLLSSSFCAMHCV